MGEVEGNKGGGAGFHEGGRGHGGSPSMFAQMRVIASIIIKPHRAIEWVLSNRL
jgi:hypothetical protein